MKTNNLNKSWMSIALFLLAGVVLGIAGAIVLTNIATPNYPQYYMSQEMFASVDISDILRYVSAQNTIILFLIYTIIIFIATKKLFGDIKLFDKQNIPTNLLILFISILIVGLAYPPFYIFFSKEMAFEVYTYSYMVVTLILFMMLISIYYFIKKINKSDIEYSHMLGYSIFYAVLIFGFEGYLLSTLYQIVVEPK